MPRLMTVALCAALCAPPVLIGLVLANPPSVALAAEQPIRLDWLRKNLMLAHYRSVLSIQDAVIRGDLAEVEPMASALAMEAPPPGLPDRSAPYLEAMRRAARRTAAATALEGAAEGTATLLATCGACHVASAIRPDLIGPPSSVIGGIVGHMLNHQQAVELMLEGLVMPSAVAWQDGARGLKMTPLHRRELPRDPQLTRTIVAAEDRLHRLADDAASAKDSAARVKVYAQVLTTCATCHRLHPDVWGPAPR